MDGYSLGYANIALVKYWGKKSKDPVLPYNPNISLRLDNLLSKTKIEKAYQMKMNSILTMKNRDLKK